MDDLLYDQQYGDEPTATIVISEELHHHFQALKDLKDNLFLDTTYAKPSEKVATMNSITKLLSQMARDLEKVHNAENFNRAKQILVGILKEVDEDLGKEFIQKCREAKV